MTTVPFALDASGEVVTALAAPRGATYTCLECGAPLGVRRGESRRWHFYHLPGFERDCAGESLTHRAAKRLLARALRRELAATGTVTWQRRCAGTGGPCPEGTLLPVALAVPGWTEVVEEVTHGAFRFDVAVLAGRDVRFGFEVFHRHAVPEHKAAALDVPWLELVAEDILAHQPRIPVRSDEGVVRCAACEERAALLAGRARDDAQRGVVDQAYEVEVRRLTTAWTTILAEVRGRARTAAPISHPSSPAMERLAPIVVEEDEETRARRQKWAALNEWVRGRRGG